MLSLGAGNYAAWMEEVKDVNKWAEGSTQYGGQVYIQALHGVSKSQHGTSWNRSDNQKQAQVI